MIIPNLTSVLSEEGQWKYPNEFNPENFLNDQGEFVKPDAFMPFSAGELVLSKWFILFQSECERSPSETLPRLSCPRLSCPVRIFFTV